MIGKQLLNGFTISPLITNFFRCAVTPLSRVTPPTQTVGGVTYVGVTGGSGVLAAGGTNRPPFFANNAFQLPRTATVDLRLEKAFTFWESRKLTFSGDAFNMFKPRQLHLCRHADVRHHGLESRVQPTFWSSHTVEQLVDQSAADSGWHSPGFLDETRENPKRAPGVRAPFLFHLVRVPLVA